MTVDCTPAVADAIERRLGDAEARGIGRVGTHRQESANLTCYVPSPARADHVHFIDGADGGYAAAAAKLKTRGQAGRRAVPWSERRQRESGRGP